MSGVQERPTTGLRSQGTVFPEGYPMSVVLSNVGGLVPGVSVSLSPVLFRSTFSVRKTLD